MNDYIMVIMVIIWTAQVAHSKFQAHTEADPGHRR